MLDFMGETRSLVLEFRLFGFQDHDRSSIKIGWPQLITHGIDYHAQTGELV